MEPVLAALAIFLLRICDVSLGTMRVMYMVRGQRIKAATLGLLESCIFIFAISRVFQNPDLPRMLGYAFGFAAGTLMGITIEGWIASGFMLVRVITRDKGTHVGESLRAAGFGVTSVRGEGRGGDLVILFVVATRRRTQEMLQIIRAHDEEAFITMDAVNTPIGGFVPRVAAPSGVRK